MNSLTENEISKDIFDLGEENIYNMLTNIEDKNAVDKSLVYCFIKAFYLHTAKLYLQSQNLILDFDKLYAAYKEMLKGYYKTNNSTIEEALLDDILNFFDKSFALIATVEFTEIQDSYEFRHYVIRVLELLRIILENNSKSVIRENIFENYTKIMVEQCDKIFIYFNP